jgi:murein tripeptide amidase MpaA
VKGRFLSCFLEPADATIRLRLPVSAVLAAAASRGMTRMVSISSAFDGGNIQVESQTAEAVQLKIKPDPYTELEKKSHMQSFAFKATADSTSPAQKVVYEIINAKDVSFPAAWDGTTVCYSTDSETWQRVRSTSYDGASGVLRWEWTHAGADASVFFAYFDLYPYERQLRLVAKCAAMAAGTQPPAGLRVRSLGQTLDGRELDCISVGTGTLQAWAIHRQHPGESQASFFAEGLLDRLLGLGTGGVIDGLVQRALRLYTFHVVPNMNPGDLSPLLYFKRGEPRVCSSPQRLSFPLTRHPHVTPPSPAPQTGRCGATCASTRAGPT